MTAAWSLVVGAPVAALLLLGYALRPRDGAHVTAPLRLAAVRAALAVGAYAVLAVEVAGAFGALTRPVIGSVWLAGAGLAAALAAARRRRDREARVGTATPARAPMARTWLPAGRLEWLLVGALGALLLAEASLALLAEPNNYDSQTYHLPRVEHWVAQRDVGFYPTAIHRQVTLAPGAEYLLLHLRLLTGGDALHHLVQWAAGLGCVLVASRIAAQLGGSRIAQVLTAFVVGTTPMVVLQASSTQNDLVAAAWAACAGTLALDGLVRRATAGSVLSLGTAVGLTAITKNSGLLAAGPLLALWAAGQFRQWARRPATGGAAGREPAPRRSSTWRAYAGSAAITAAAAAGVLVVAAALAGPFVTRIVAEFGHPFGPPVLRESVPMQRHDPASILINGLKVAHTALDSPLRPVAGAAATGIIDLARLLGMDPQDRATTFGATTFPVAAWYPDEDRAAFPITGGLALVGVAFALVAPRRITVAARGGRLRAYGAAVAASVVLYVAVVKWQPWGNRLLLFAVVLAAPLAGLCLAALLRPAEARHNARPGDAHDEPGPGGAGRRTVATWLAGALLATAALAGILSVGYGFPRRLVGSGSAVTADDWQIRFIRRPQWAEQFRWAASAVEATGARRVGLVQQNDTWEYPWWLLLRNHEIVSLQSVLPHHPPPNPASVDAIICTGPRTVCVDVVPAGWRIHHRGYVGYALPPAR